MRTPPQDIDPRSISEETPRAWIYGFAQGSAEWLAARGMAVGGSTIAALLGVSRYSTREQAVAGLRGGPELQMTEIILRGSVGEAYVRDYIQGMLGLQNLREVGIAVHKEYPWMRASPDGLYTSGSGGIGIIEIKVVSSFARREAIGLAVERIEAGLESAGDAMPEEHRHQMHYTAGVTGADEITYAVLVWPQNGHGRIIIRQFPADEALFADIHIPAARAAYDEARRAGLPA